MEISGDKLTVFLLINNQAETHITFPELVTVPNGSSDPDYGASILIRNCPITYLGLPLLRDTPGVALDSCDALTSFEAPSMETNSVRLLNCDGLRHISLPVFVGGFFAVINCPLLSSLLIPLMPDGQLEITANVGLKSISFPAFITGGVNLSACSNLKALCFDALTVITDTVFGFNVYDNVSLEVLSLPATADCQTTLNVNANPVLKIVNVPGAVTIRNCNIVNNAQLTTINLGEALFSNGFDHLFSGNALTVESVNDLLAQCVNSGLTGGTIDLSGGTNAAPTGAGLINKAALIAAGCTVNTN